MFKKILIISALFSLVMAACKSTPKNDSAAQLKGIYFYDQDYSVLRLCTDASEYWIVPGDELKRLLEKEKIKPMQGIYLELKGNIGLPQTEGPGSKYESIFEVTEISKFSTDLATADCAIKNVKVSDELTGTSPRKWKLNFEGTDIRFQAWDKDTLLFFSNLAPVESTPLFKRYHIMNEGGAIIDFVIEEKPCESDGRKFPKAAGVRISCLNDTFVGCARIVPEKLQKTASNP